MTNFISYSVERKYSPYPTVLLKCILIHIKLYVIPHNNAMRITDIMRFIIRFVILIFEISCIAVIITSTQLYAIAVSGCTILLYTNNGMLAAKYTGTLRNFWYKCFITFINRSINHVIGMFLNEKSNFNEFYCFTGWSSYDGHHMTVII
jgi:hypothetical protein